MKKLLAGIRNLSLDGFTIVIYLLTTAIFMFLFMDWFVSIIGNNWLSFGIVDKAMHLHAEMFAQGDIIVNYNLAAIFGFCAGGGFFTGYFFLCFVFSCVFYSYVDFFVGVGIELFRFVCSFVKGWKASRSTN